jgi:Arc/MetJ-type ribon-helix-helix transcriptional regulator
MTQVAFQLPDEDLEAIDAMVPGEFASRAEALRDAVRQWLKGIEEQRIDAALAVGYSLVPQGADEAAWADLSIEGLAAGELDW